MPDPTEPDQATQAEEKVDANRSHSADRPGTDDEEQAADNAYAAESDQQRRDVAAHEKEMMDIGANLKGEGAIE